MGGGVQGVWKDMATCDLTYQIPINQDNGVLCKAYMDSISSFNELTKGAGWGIYLLHLFGIIAVHLIKLFQKKKDQNFPPKKKKKKKEEENSRWIEKGGRDPYDMSQCL